MQTSERELMREAKETGFRPEIMEKVWHLMAILDGISVHSFLKERLVLKGGTALNLFFFDLPRLSVDIDLNYIGQLDRQEMLLERPEMEKALEAVFQREGLSIRRTPEKHAGGKWQLRYASALGGNGNLEVDLNYMLRVPLYGIHNIGTRKTKEIPLLDIHELGAGKLSALFGRHASRDLFDAHQLLTKCSLGSSNYDLHASYMEPWGQFSIMDQLWLYTIQALREFGLPLDRVKNAKDIFFAPIENFPFSIMEYYTSCAYILLEDVFLIVFSDGFTIPLTYSEYQNALKSNWIRNYVQVNINEMIQKIFQDPNLEPRYKDEASITPQEFEVLHMIRTGNFEEIKIRFTSGSIYLLEGIEDLSKVAKIGDIIREGNYQDLEVKQENGRVVSLRRTIRKLIE